MSKYLRVFLLTCVFMAMCAVALAFNPGQRTFNVLGNVLNSDKHPVHLVITQKIDMKDILTPEAYEKLEPAKRFRINRVEYNESNGINAERTIVTDGEGKVVKDCNSFVKGGYWYTVDYLNKTYDRLPELPNMSMPFAETLISWFGTKPEMGNDPDTGYDYDKMVRNNSTLYFYFEKDTDKFVGYKVSHLPMFQVVEVSEAVDEAKVFELPPADFKQVADETMRNYANRLMAKRK